MTQYRLNSELRLLHVDDDPGLTELVADFFDRSETPQCHVISKTDPEAAKEVVVERGDQIDCIISDYDMPGTDGLEFLDFVRDSYVDLPFILFTGKGSEEIASQAINAGVTGYLQKGGMNQLERLQSRVIHAVDEYRAKIESERYTTVLRALDYPIYVVDDTAEFAYINDAFVELTGYDRDEIIGASPKLIKSNEGAERANDMLRSIVSADGPERQAFGVEIQTKTGETIPCRDHMAALPFDDDFRGSVGILRDIRTEEQQRERLKEQNKQFEEIISIASHDLRTPITQAQLGLELAQQETESAELVRVETAIERIDNYIKELETLAASGITVNGTGEIAIDQLAQRAWKVLGRQSDKLEVVPLTVRGDPERTKSLIENLLRNAIEHTDPGVTVRVGPIGPGSGAEIDGGDENQALSGFYVEDSGGGIKANGRDEIFEPGFSTTDGGSGLGLSIVKRIAHAHEWEISVEESSTGGARFELTGVNVRS
jgi:PAS domain S-box-containing protein